MLQKSLPNRIGLEDWRSDRRDCGTTHALTVLPFHGRMEGCDRCVLHIGSLFDVGEVLLWRVEWCRAAVNEWAQREDSPRRRRECALHGAVVPDNRRVHDCRQFSVRLNVRSHTPLNFPFLPTTRHLGQVLKPKVRIDHILDEY